MILVPRLHRRQRGQRCRRTRSSTACRRRPACRLRVRPAATGPAAAVGLLGVLLVAAALLSDTIALIPSPSELSMRRRHQQHQQWLLPSPRRGAAPTTLTNRRTASAHLLPPQRPSSEQAFDARKLSQLAFSSSSSVASSESSKAKGELSEPSALNAPSEIHVQQQHRANATTLTLESSGDEDEPALPTEPGAKLPFPLVLWKFSRPHTLIGSAIAIPALHFLAAPALSAAFTSKTIASVLYAMLPSLLMNIYITGLNQISDVEIDRINKPYLVLPAGIMSRSSAIATVLVCLVLSLGLGQVPTPWTTEGLNVALWGSAILGTMYSVEPFRLKRSPLLAALCIVAVRGTIINASFFAHATAAAFGGASGSGSVLRAILTDRKCVLSSLFYCVFGVVIALMKDVPDVQGDLSSRVRTFSVRLGQDRVFHWSRRLLTGLFWAFGAGLMQSAVATALRSAQVPIECVFRACAAVASLWAGQSVRRQSRGVDPNDSAQVYEYYMHLWKLFYGSYLALPFAR